MIDTKEIVTSFPRFLENDVASLLKKTSLETDTHISQTFRVIVKDERLKIPYRIYFNQPDGENLNKREALTLNCLFTRHHNGFVRQSNLNRILLPDEYRITPFILQLSGEYVIEILQTIEQRLSEKLLDNILQFSAENPGFFETTKSRIISYWNCYYRFRFPNKKDYVGFKILSIIASHK